MFLQIIKVKQRFNHPSRRIGGLMGVQDQLISPSIKKCPQFIHSRIGQLGCPPALLPYRSMNKLTSLAQIKAYKAKELSTGTHVTLSGTLQHFLPNPTITALTYTYSFPKHSLPFLHEKMSRIGTIADEMDHHPEWTLREGELEVRLSTHDIGNKVSLKDYVLASWIEKVLHGEELETALLREWNGKELNLQELQ